MSPTAIPIVVPTLSLFARSPTGKVREVCEIAMASSPSMCRHLCSHRDGVVALVAMASLSSPMHRRLAVVDDDGDGVAGDNIDNDDEGATYNDIDDDCDGATGDEVDDDCDIAMGEEVDDDCDGTT